MPNVLSNETMLSYSVSYPTCCFKCFNAEGPLLSLANSSLNTS